MSKKSASKKSQSKKAKETKGLISELSGLEVELGKKREAPRSGELVEDSVDKVPAESAADEEPDLRGIDFERELERVLSFRAPKEEAVAVNTGGDLEGAVFFGPPPSSERSGKTGGVDYSGANYESKYKEDNYQSKTPSYTAGSAGEGSEAGSSGKSFRSRAEQNSESGNNGQ